MWPTLSANWRVDRRLCAGLGLQCPSQRGMWSASWQHHSEASVSSLSREAPATKRAAVSKVCLLSLLTVSVPGLCMSPRESCGLDSWTAICFVIAMKAIPPGLSTGLIRHGRSLVTNSASWRWTILAKSRLMLSHVVYGARGVVLYHNCSLRGFFEGCRRITLV